MGSDRWVAVLWLFGVFCLVCLLVVFVWLVCWVVLWFLCCFVSSVASILSCLRTEAVKPAVCLSEWALGELWRLLSLVRDVVVSLSVMDCLYPRDPPQPVRKKNHPLAHQQTSPQTPRAKERLPVALAPYTNRGGNWAWPSSAQPSSFWKRMCPGPPADQDSSFWMEVPSGADWRIMVGQQGGHLWSCQCPTLLGADGSPPTATALLCISRGGLGIRLCGWLLLDPTLHQLQFPYTGSTCFPGGHWSTFELEENRTLWDHYLAGLTL